jgi:hypothetical protein
MQVRLAARRSGLRGVLSNACSIAVPLSFGLAVSSAGISALLVGGAFLFGAGIWPAHQGAIAARVAKSGARSHERAG